MSSYRPIRDYVRVLGHFASIRSLEVLVLQASPFFGGFLGGFQFEWEDLIRLILLLLGSLFLTAHIFILNDWAGHNSDKRDPRRTTLVFTQQKISRVQVAHVAIAFLIVANIFFFMVGPLTMLFGAAIAVLSLLYSCSPRFGKVTPIAASINHLVGGMLHFLLGYTLFHELDGRGLAISLFFGLVFAGGHFNQEVRDYEGDSINGIRTSAVVFGPRRTFLASLSLFTLAYALIIGLAATSMLPNLLYGSFIPWFLHVAWSVQTLRQGLGFEAILKMQRRFRLLFAITGLAMLIR
ncbi:hypothetical protein FEM03_11950 [Phragmitibacter flavus]|uniref:Prenyltransferase n=1 Tax=Phragmitibacter flavus TaxID=2576071 RepID=A0A5R8KEM8_9BACT|nr:UbiA family prenyltransferase [Phragmitibacter flavus]TLD70435.1 hypothetical protein FEM03_11950 [Phragmitibacter flavus]